MAFAVSFREGMKYTQHHTNFVIELCSEMYLYVFIYQNAEGFLFINTIVSYDVCKFCRHMFGLHQLFGICYMSKQKFLPYLRLAMVI